MTLKYESWQDDMYEREVNQKAVELVTDKLENDADFLRDALGSISDDMILELVNESPDLKKVLVNICKFWAGIQEEAEEIVKQNRTLREEIEAREEEDRLDMEQQRLEADEAAYASKYGGID